MPSPVGISVDENPLCPVEQTVCELLLLEESDLQQLQLPQQQHHVSWPGLLPCPREGGSAECPIHHHRIRIAYYSDAIREHTLANAQRLLVLAASTVTPPPPPSANGDGSSTCSSTSPSNNSAMLARKALRYRKIYERMDGVDVTDPCFNASRFLGVTWHKLVP